MARGVKGSTPSCSADGCDSKSLARGLCRLHYKRWQATQRPPRAPRLSETARACEFCGEEYRSRRPEQRFCSLRCRSSLRHDRDCTVCGKTFHPRIDAAKYCSAKCCGQAKRKYSWKDCPTCGQSFYSRSPNARYCSQTCHYDASPGRLIIGEGYVKIRVPDGTPGVHRKAQCRSWMLEHRYVMQQELGRPLEAHETIHHINGDKTDNRPGNLELRTGRHGRGATKHCLTCTCGSSP